MKILHVIEDISSHSGGPSISALSMACALSCIDDNTIGFLCYKKSGHNTTIKNSTHYPGYTNIKWHVISKKGHLEKFLPFKFTKELLKALPQYNIVSIHGSWLPALIITGIVCILNKKPYIIVPHGMLDPWTLAYKKWKKFFVWHLFWKPIVNNANMVRALTHDEKNSLLNIGITAPIEVIPNGIFKSQYDSFDLISKNVLSNIIPSEISSPYILFLSRIHYKKGLDILINAFSLVIKSNKDAKLVIAGPDENYWNTADSIINLLNLNNNVLYVGPVYGEDKFKILKNAICFCLPSRQEGFSMAIIEAMAVGTPVIISNECHFNEVFTNSAGLVTSLDHNDVAHAILELLNNTENTTQMGQNASKLIKDRYTWEYLAQKLNNCISQYIQSC